MKLDPDQFLFTGSSVKISSAKTLKNKFKNNVMVPAPFFAGVRIRIRFLRRARFGSGENHRIEYTGLFYMFAPYFFFLYILIVVIFFYYFERFVLKI